MARIRVVNDVNVKPMISLASGVVDGLRVDQRMKLIREGGLPSKNDVRPSWAKTLKEERIERFSALNKSKRAERRSAKKKRRDERRGVRTAASETPKTKPVKSKPNVTPSVLEGIDRNKENYAERLVALNRLGFKTYDDYRVSELWYGIRKRVIGIKGCRCSLCPKRYDCIHHHSYRRDVLSGANIQPLFPLCNECHTLIEFADGKKRQMSEVQKIFRKLMQEKHIKPC